MKSSGQANAPANASMQWHIVLICLFLQMNSITKLNVNRVTRFVSLSVGYHEMNSQRVFLQDSPCTRSSTLPVSTKIGCLVVLTQILGYVICCLVIKMCLQAHLRELINHVPKK
jgi:hypothetical protein